MTRRLDSLQALRGVACLAVVAYHAAEQEYLFGLGFSPLRWVRWVGYAGVDLFFVLSGVLITLSARGGFGRPRRLPGYLFRRAWRIYPTYWAAVVLALGLYRLTGPVGHVLPDTPTGWRDDLLLLPQSGVPKLLPVSWTLSYELLFYLVVGGLFLLPQRAAGPVLAGWAACVVVWTLSYPPPVGAAVAQAVNPLVLEFLAGAALGLIGVPVGRRAARWLLLAAVVWTAVGSAMTFHPDAHWLPSHYLPRVLVFGPATALLVAAGVSWDRAGGRPPRRWLVAVGDASYSVYLIHVPVQVVIMFAAMWVSWPHSRAPHLVWVVVMLAVPVAAGVALHRLVERPLLRLLSKPQPGQRPAPGA